MAGPVIFDSDLLDAAAVCLCEWSALVFPQWRSFIPRQYIKKHLVWSSDACSTTHDAHMEVARTGKKNNNFIFWFYNTIL